MTPEHIDRPAILAEVTAAFYRYEQALVSNDVAVLDELFWHDARTVRLGAGENLYGLTRFAPFARRVRQRLDRTLQYGHHHFWR